MKEKGLEQCATLPDSHSWSTIQRSLMDLLEADQQLAVENETSKTASFTAKQCRDRWLNHLRPGIVKGNWTNQEKEQIVQMASSNQ